MYAWQCLRKLKKLLYIHSVIGERVVYELNAVTNRIAFFLAVSEQLSEAEDILRTAARLCFTLSPEEQPLATQSSSHGANTKADADHK